MKTFLVWQLVEIDNDKFLCDDNIILKALNESKWEVSEKERNLWHR
jgi:hypothetical protein